MAEDFSEEFTDEKLRELHRFVQQAALHGYPNPERAGCPGLRVLEEVAAAPAPFKHPAYEHVKHCSPCLREMLELRGEKIKAGQISQAREPVVDAAESPRISPLHAARRSRPPLVWTTAFAAGLVVALLIWRTIGHPGYQSQPATTFIQNVASVSYDARWLTSFRGAGEANEKHGPELSLIRSKHLYLSIAIPVGSDAGAYDIRLCKLDDPNPICLSTGAASVQTVEHNTLLTTTLDTSRLSKGEYSLFFRHRSSSTWQVIPAHLE